MKTEVVAYTGDRTSRIESRDLRPPRSGEAVLRVRISGLCGTDLFKLSTNAPASGTVLGHEIVGIIEMIGDEVTQFAEGDRVVVPHHVACGTCLLCARGSDTLCPLFRENLLEPGGFSERVVVCERGVRLAMRKIPEHVTDEAALFVEPAACVLRGIRRAGLPFRDSYPTSAAVLGGGSMGLLHLLVLKAIAPSMRVAVLDPIETRRTLARTLGAVDTSETSSFDVVFDTVGGADPLSIALDMTREGGTVILFAHARSGERAGFVINDLFKHERRVIATYSGSLADQEAIFDLIVRGQLDASPLVTHRLRLSQFDVGVTLCRTREALKVVFVPS